VKITARGFDELTQIGVVVTENRTALKDTQLKLSNRPETVVVMVGGGPLLPAPGPLRPTSSRRASRQSSARRTRAHRALYRRLIRKHKSAFSVLLMFNI
jgi:hypothetical protein